MGGEGFEPSKALPSDLQSDPFDHSGNPPLNPVIFLITNKIPAHKAGEKNTQSAGLFHRGFHYELAEGLEPTTC